MTELRDVRLRKALDEAPDAALQPHARTRHAIRAAAHAAVQPRWRRWRRWWTGLGRGGSPWAAALATVALATLVTVAWEGREVPGAGTDVAQERPVTAPAAPAVAPEVAPPPAAAPPSAPPATEPALQQPVAPPPAAPAQATPQRERAAATAKRGAERAAAARQEAPTRVPPAAADASAPQAQQRQAFEERSAATPAAPMAAPAPAEAPPAAAAQRAAPREAARWTQVRVELGERSVVLPPQQAGKLFELIDRLLAAPRGDGPPVSTPVTLRLELAQGDDAIGVLEHLGEHWRWRPLRSGEPARILRPEPALGNQLQQEAERLLR